MPSSTLRVILLALPLTVTANCQVSAVLSGTVRDQSGAVVTAATINVTNVDTGATRLVVSGADGRYVVPSLPVGAYQIRAAKAGFAEEVRSGVHLAVGQAAIVDIELKVGGSAERIA